MHGCKHVDTVEPPDLIELLTPVMAMPCQVYWNRFLTEVFFRDASLPTQAQAAGRGHKLYARTAPAPSSEGVARAKVAMSRGQLPHRVHYWFRELAHLSGQTLESNGGLQRRQELEEHAPRDKRALPFAWQRDLWDTAESFRHHLESKQQALVARQQLEALKKSVATHRCGGGDSRRGGAGPGGDALTGVGEADPPSVAGASSGGVPWDMGRGRGGVEGMGSKPKKSGRQKLLEAQSFVCPDIDSQTAASHEEAFKDRALAVDTGGEMRDGSAAPTVEDLVVDLQADNAADLKRRASQRKVWDKKKMRYVNAEHVSGAQGRELRVRNGAGQRMALRRPADGLDGDLYAKWKREHKLKIQAPGHTENIKNQRKAAAQALVTLRNSRAGAAGAGAAAARGGEGGAPARHAASILAGPKRGTPALVKVSSQGQVVPAVTGSSGGKRDRDRKMRAERQRQRCVPCPPRPHSRLPRALPRCALMLCRRPLNVSCDKLARGAEAACVSLSYVAPGRCGSPLHCSLPRMLALPLHFPGG